METTALTAALSNAATTLIACFLVMLIQGYRAKEETFDPVVWAIDNRSRFIVGLLIVALYTVLTVLSPDVATVLEAIGFNTNAKVPISMGLALAAFLLGGVKKNPPLA